MDGDGLADLAIADLESGQVAAGLWDGAAQSADVGAGLEVFLNGPSF